MLEHLICKSSSLETDTNKAYQLIVSIVQGVDFHLSNTCPNSILISAPTNVTDEELTRRIDNYSNRVVNVTLSVKECTSLLFFLSK